MTRRNRRWSPFRCLEQWPQLRRGALFVPAAVAVLAFVIVRVSPADGGFTASVGDGGSSSTATGTGSLQLSAASGGTTLCSTGIGAATASCSGGLVPATIGGSPQVTTISETGSLTPSSTTLTETTCAPMALTNAASPADPMLVRGGTTTAVASAPALSGSAGVTVDGTSGFVSDVAASYPASNPGGAATSSSFSEAVWFKTSSTSGTSGNLLGLTGDPGSGSPGSVPNDLLYLDSKGGVDFGVLTTAGTLSSVARLPGGFGNGAWHLAVGVYTALTPTTGTVQVYVDGVPSPLISLAGVVYTPTGSAGQGYWHAGWASESGTAAWPNAPASAYFAGTETDAAILGTALSPAAVLALSQSGTQAAWSAQVAASSPIDSWTLGDPPTTMYAGSPSWYTAANGSPNGPCQFVDATVGVSQGSASSCASPAGSGACPAPGGSLSSLLGTSLTLPSPTPATPLTVTVTTARDPAYAAVGPMSGLHLQLAFTVAAASGGFTAALSWPQQNLPLTG